MSTGVVIFARLDSQRLPGKALIDIEGKPMLGRVIERALEVTSAEKVILATTERSVDDPLAEFAAQEGIGCYRGDCDDVAGRALACAQKFKLKVFARLCGDRPFFDPKLMNDMFALYKMGGDLITTLSDRPYPPGLTTEVISTQALERACSLMDELEDHEHLTRFFYRKKNLFSIVRLPAPSDIDFTGVRLVVDDEQDLSRARYIARSLDKQSGISSIENVVTIAQSWNNNLQS